MKDASTLEEDLRSAPSTKSIVRTDGQGAAVDVWGEPASGETECAQALDITSAALTVLGPRLGLGRFRDAVLTFTDGVIVLAEDGEAAVMAVLADATARPGLLLHQVRRLVANDPSDGEGGE